MMHNHGDERRVLMIEMKIIEERLSYARDLMLSKQLDPADINKLRQTVHSKWKSWKPN
jgi:hypothetical protein